MKKKVFVVLGSMMLIAFILSTPNVSADTVFDWNDGTTQGWSPVEPFGGTLSVDMSFGNPAGSLYAIDTVSGGGDLFARAPSVFSGDLSIHSGIQWDEYVPDRGSLTVRSTRAFILGTDGTVYTTKPILGPLKTWNTRFAAFNDPTAWVLYNGSASFSDVVHNVQALGIDLETSEESGVGLQEAWIDNVRLSAITIGTPYVFTSNQSDSGGAFPIGHSFLISANVSPAGPSMTVTAQQLTGGSHNVNMGFWPQPISVAEYDYRTPWDSSFNGQWQITATDGVNVATRVTSTLDDPRLLPLAETFSASTGSGALTPTLAWTGFDGGQFPGFSGTPVNGSDDFNIRIRVRNLVGKTLWQSSLLSTSITSLTLPSNALAQGQNYLLDVILQHFDYESSAWCLENRSETFLQYSTQIVTIIGDTVPTDCDVDGSDLAVLIANPSLMELAIFAQNFGRSGCQ